MKQYNFLKLSLLLISIVLFLINGCDSNKSKELEIIGEWKAYWETTADETMPELNGDNLKMTGVVKFMDNGKVEICAFGYKGCIFSDDTLKNTLNWILDDTVLRFIDSGDDYGLAYTINKFNSQELHLTLLEDIKLTLHRN